MKKMFNVPKALTNNSQLTNPRSKVSTMRLRNKSAMTEFLLTYLPTNVLTLKKAFTLAEVLITLAIIGVVAALTIPNLMLSAIGNGYTKQARITQNMLTKVFQSSLPSVYGTAENFPNMNSVEFFESLEKYLPPIREKSGFMRSADLPTPYWQPIKGSKLYEGAVFELEDNTIISFTTYNMGGRGFFIAVDVNGREEPNVLGKDIFYLTFTSSPELPNGDRTFYKFFAYGQVKPLGWRLSDADVVKYCMGNKGWYNNSALLSKSMGWTTIPGDGYFPSVAAWQGSTCLELLNRLNWNLNEYPIKKFSSVEE